MATPMQGLEVKRKQNRHTCTVGTDNAGKVVEGTDGLMTLVGLEVFEFDAVQSPHPDNCVPDV